jgi:pimeloyl-ACP methyl ester carboxylesterase
MPTIFVPARDGHEAAVRVLLLPPAYADPDDFLRAGFERAVRKRGLALDLVFAPLELAHVTDRSIIARLHEAVLQPARQARCSLWLGGVSLGGFVALRCAEQYSQQLAGLCLFAPYLGSYIMTGEIERARGAHAWEPGEPSEDDDERRVWRFIKTRAARFPIHLGMAHADRFADRHAVLAAALPAGDVDRVDGGHDWPTWRRLWDNFLDARFAGLAARA